MIDLNHVVRETLELRADEQAANNIDAVTALASGLPPVFADAHRIQQVLLNLMNNAEQAMVAAHGRGSLVVRTWHDASVNTVSFEVSDDGPGLAPEIRTRIFDAFFTTKPVGEGTGLGLAVAYNIVKDHGGRIRVESEPGRGTSFVVDLPVTATTEPAAAPAVAPTPGDVLRGASVLVVEDEEALASAIGEALQDAGMKVDIAGDGEDALARVRGGRYDTVICDLKMPRVSGMVIYRAIAAGTPSLARRVIFVTGDAADGRRRALSRRERLPLAGQAVPHRRLAARRPRHAGVIDDHRGRCRTLSVAGQAARSVALAIFGLWNSRIALRRILNASAPGAMCESASRNRPMARACSCDTRDSLTPISAPICFIVASL